MTAPFDTRAAADELDEQYPPFPFVGLDGATHHLPSPMALSSTRLRAGKRALESGDDDEMFAFFRTIADEAAVAAMEDLPTGVLVRLINAWQAHAEEQGKSLGVSSETPASNVPAPQISLSAGSTSTS